MYIGIRIFLFSKFPELWGSALYTIMCSNYYTLEINLGRINFKTEKNALCFTTQILKRRNALSNQQNIDDHVVNVEKK